MPPLFVRTSVVGKEKRRAEANHFLSKGDTMVSSDIQSIKGIGPKKAEKLHRMGIVTLLDMLSFYPRGHESWTLAPSIRDIPREGNIMVKGAFAGSPGTLRIRKGLTITRWTLTDESGAIECVWYNQPYRAKQYQAEKVYGIMGCVGQKGRRQIVNPRIIPAKEVNTGTKYLPVYPLSEGVSQRDMRHLAQEAMRELDAIRETLPVTIREEYNLCDIREAVKQIHFPQSGENLDPARRRIVFEEFFWYQLALAQVRRHRQENVLGPNCPIEKEDVDAFLSAMPFTPTGAQVRTIGEIAADIAHTYPMNRLVHGDVGSGKTLIAAFCLYAAWKNGYQGAIMAPTEVLARQLHKVLTGLLKPFGIRTACLTGSHTLQEKAQIKDALASGDIDVIAGTHALIQEDVAFANLGMVVTDEQHRFGVRQRSVLKAKGGDVHMLVMSATPIPRTMALLFFGDLDVSTLDELPKGRKPIRTDLVDQRYRSRIYRFIRERVKCGEQAYMICPLVTESEALEAQAAVSYYEAINKGPLMDINIGLLHGKMKAAEKESAMRGFTEGSIQVLVSTTVVEVGVDAPDATVMVIENAERFGLSQLHQLRGRVGRGSRQSYCILISDTQNEDTQKRLKFLTETNDGFAVSEEDLKLRGPGDFFGTRQHGVPAFDLADPIRHMGILKEASHAAHDVVEGSYGDGCESMMEKALNQMEDREKRVLMN